MIVADKIIGNIHQDESDLKTYEKYKKADKVETVTLDSNERKRSRVRTTTDEGTEIGIIVGDKSGLEEGDLLALEDDRLVIVEFETQETMVIEYPLPDDFDDLAAAVELGHIIGNHHWELVVREHAFYIPLSEEKRIMEDVIESELPSEATINYEQMSEFDLPTHQHHHHHHSHD